MTGHSTITIRLARNRDIEQIATLSRDVIEHGLRWKWTPRAVRGLLRQPNVVGIVAEVGDKAGTVAGFGILRVGHEHTGNLDLLAVHPGVQRRGLGMKLLRWLEDWGRSAGLTHITLQVRRRSRGARRFYSALGYHERSTLRHYYQGREDAVSMARDIRRHPQLTLTVGELMQRALMEPR